MKKIHVILSALLLSFFFTATTHAEDLSWEELNAKVTGFYKQQQFTTAAGYAKEALKLARKSDDIDHLSISLNNMTQILIETGKVAEAEQMSKEDIALLQKTYGVDGIQVAVPWNNLGLVYYFKKKMDDAEFCFQEIVRINEVVYGKKSSDIVPALKKLEKFYKKTENTGEADKIAARILALQTGPE